VNPPVKVELKNSMIGECKYGQISIGGMGGMLDATRREEVEWKIKSNHHWSAC
jgi:hypothetical protein